MIAAAIEPATPPSASRVGRDGSLSLRFERRQSRTVVTRCRYALPLQVMAPLALDDCAAVVSILNPTGGLVGGDRLGIDVTAAAGAHACVTTPSASRVYRTGGAPAVQEVTLTLEPRALLEWVPEHTIPFSGSVFEQAIAVQLASDARLILIDSFAAGRIACGEAWRFRRLESTLRIRDDRGWLLYDRFVLAGGRPWNGLGFTEGACYFGSVVVVGDTPAGVALDDALREVLSDSRGSRAAIGTLARRGRVVRCLAPTAPALIALVERVWSAARVALIGRPAPPLRKL